VRIQSRGCTEKGMASQQAWAGDRKEKVPAKRWTFMGTFLRSHALDQVSPPRSHSTQTDSPRATNASSPLPRLESIT
jgi:hypothetical protein